MVIAYLIFVLVGSGDGQRLLSESQELSVHCRTILELIIVYWPDIESRDADTNKHVQYLYCTLKRQNNIAFSEDEYSF